MAHITLDITGKWQFKEYPLSARRMRDLDSAGWQQTTVPCSIFTSLIEAGQIKLNDIYNNPGKFAYISEKPWIYKKTFDAADQLLDCGRIDLIFDGLDTIASIWLNDKLIGKTDNMFISYRFDVTEVLKPQNNTLLVKFESATQHAKRLMKRYTEFNQSTIISPHRAYIRKAQYQFGWDFCPALPGCGIWQPVRLEGIKKARFDDVQIRTIDCNQQFADIRIAIGLDAITKNEFSCKLILTGNEQKIEHQLTFEAGENYQSTVIRIEKPQLWWPVGYGRQYLYNLELQLVFNDQIVDQSQKRFGIRTVKLNRPKDEYGQKFQFEINGQTVFAKGANWIPISIFAGSVTDEDYSKLLQAVAECNINMLRVWGGGYYETEKFYELCNELGILVWQDFMFACSYYPDRKWFLDEVKKEAIAVIKRLRNHPSLVLWCGNNEIDWMHNAGKFGSGKKFYGKEIYHKILPKLVAELDSDTPYIATTPIATDKNSNDPHSGTFHQWDVWSGYRPIRQYQCRPEDIPRFVTEFGMQSVPSIKTIQNLCPAEKLHLGSYEIEKYNHQLDGNSRLYRYVCDLFGQAKNLEQFIYFSQVTQARAVKRYIEHLRAHNFRNSGALFWQFNDCCPAISWSALDYTKEPKALFYYATRFFSKLLVTVVPESKRPKANQPPEIQSLNLVVINDSGQPLTATLSCRLIDLSGNQLDQAGFPIAIGPFRTSTPIKLPKAIAFPENPDKSVLYLVIEKDGKKIAENLFLYLPDKYIDWPKVQVNKDLSRTDDGKWKLKLKSNAIAKDIQIYSAAEAQLSNNFIDLITPFETEIIITAQQKDLSLEPDIELYSVNSMLSN